MLRQKPIIQKILASLLLVLFTISFIPKSYFHNVIAHHTDSATCAYSVEKLCIHQKGFSCSFNDLAVTAPYVLLSSSVNLLQPYLHPTYTGWYCIYILHQAFFSTESRGPPFVVA